MKRTYRWDKEQGKLVELERERIAPRIHIIPDIKPYLDENMDHNPVYVKSRRHKMQLLKERGLTIK